LNKIGYHIGSGKTYLIPFLVVLFIGSYLTGLVTVSAASLSYPSDTWQRLWYDRSSGAYLGEGPNEPSITFDNNWGSGVVAYGRSNDVWFSSSRTITLPTTGVYTFKLGSDDGTRLWVDDTLILDRWVDRAYSSNSVNLNLASGSHRFRIDYYERGGDARASFSYVAPSQSTQYTITASAGANGVISPSGSVSVSQGSGQSFTVTPNSGYVVSSVVVDGSSVGAVSSYTFSNVQESHTISASFTQQSQTTATFVETCDKFDTSIWSYEGKPPTVSNGEWVFRLVGGAGYQNIRPFSRSLTKFGYGHYKLTFRTSGARVSGANYCPFLIYEGGSGYYNELDIPELFGSMGSRQMSISTYRNSILVNGIPPDESIYKEYVYWNSPVNYEDGAYHTWEWDFNPPDPSTGLGLIKFWVDGALALTWTSKCTAVTPMYFYMMVAGSPASSWTFYLSQIEYTPM
jgi:hypothetical protein